MIYRFCLALLSRHVFIALKSLTLNLKQLLSIILRKKLVYLCRMIFHNHNNYTQINFDPVIFIFIMNKINDKIIIKIHRLD